MKTLSSIMATLLLATVALPGTAAPQLKAEKAVVGLWSVFVQVEGAPPCQCIQISRFTDDGKIEGPANDRFTSAAMGEWRAKSANTIAFTIVQSAINPDGSAGGEYVIRGTLTIKPSGDAATGSTQFQILDSTGTPIFAGSTTLTAVKVQVE